jgi:hypothetical protein
MVVEIAEVVVMPLDPIEVVVVVAAAVVDQGKL